METNLEHYVRLVRELALRQITPAKIVGTGYKNARECAYEYLTRMIAVETELLREKGVL
jgi:hypothetical protein